MKKLYRYPNPQDVNKKPSVHGSSFARVIISQENDFGYELITIEQRDLEDLIRTLQIYKEKCEILYPDSKKIWKRSV